MGYEHLPIINRGRKLHRLSKLFHPMIRFSMAAKAISLVSSLERNDIKMVRKQGLVRLGFKPVVFSILSAMIFIFVEPSTSGEFH